MRNLTPFIILAVTLPFSSCDSNSADSVAEKGKIDSTERATTNRSSIQDSGVRSPPIMDTEQLPDGFSQQQTLNWLKRRAPYSESERESALSWLRKKSDSQNRAVDVLLSEMLQTWDGDRVSYSSILSDLLQKEPDLFLKVIKSQPKGDWRSSAIAEFVGRASSAKDVSTLRDLYVHLESGRDRQAAVASLANIVVETEGAEAAMIESSAFEYPEERKLALFQITTYLRTANPIVTRSFADRFRALCRENGLDISHMNFSISEN